MSKYAHIDENNILKGFYDNEVHDSIPTPNVSLTDEQWQTALDNNHNYIANDGSSKTVTLELTAEEKVAGAHAYLNSTDWYVVRKADTGKAIPEDVTTKRIEARQTINDLEE
tara:strand:- start:1991 stop:2326 length:336 start_codon:yes stop_codon:yes gene_type:complete